MVSRSRILVLALLLFIATNTALCVPKMSAPYAKQAPVVDGIINEREWQATQPVFFPANSTNPMPGKPAACELRALWTKQGLYIAFQTVETTPAYGHAAKGAPLYQEDSFEIFVDSIGDYRQYYEIQLDPAGRSFFKTYVLTAPPRLTPQGRLTPEFSTSEYWRYDWPLPDGFKVASKLDRNTHIWTLEVFLPAAFVNRRRGGAPLKPGTWRVNFVRHDWDAPKGATKRNVKYMYWAPVLPGHPHLSPTLMGYLTLENP